MASQERFGYEWDKYSHMTPMYEKLFRGWVYPLQPADFAGKKVLDAGCGMGRNSYFALRYGAASVTAFDLDPRSLAAARRTLKDFPNASVSLQSIYDLSYKDEFDLAFSIGVIHHLERPQEALHNLVRALRPGGTLLVWVYGYEGNEWIVRYVNPVRKYITSRLPLPMVHLLSYFCSVPLYIFVKIFRGPSAYLRQMSAYEFWHIHSIVFDQLIPKVANYWKKGEVEALCEPLELSHLDIHAPENKSGWIIIGKK
jgi:SAM-dependent methyltransferase